MPKVAKAQNALKKTRKFLSIIKNGNCEITSDSEESISSIESGDLAHIPIENTPSLENLSLIDSENMEEIGVQLQKMMQMMDSFAAKQKEHDTMFSQIESHLNGGTSAVEPVAQPTANLEQLSRIPDPIKMIPVFDGNTKQLNAWLTTAEETLNAFKNHVTPLQYKMYVTAVTSKIQGKAKDIICLAGNPDNFENIKEVLINALGDRQELSTYKCQLWQCRMTEGMSISRYYHKSKEIIQNIKTLAKQRENYKNNWEAISDFIDEDALAAFIAGLSEPYFGYAQAARPKDIEDAYAFLCKFKSKEITARSMASDNSTTKYQKHKDFEHKSNNKSHFQNSNNQFNKIHNPSNKPFKLENPRPERNEVEPMDATTTRSRLTINRKVINNPEITQREPKDEIAGDLKSDIESDDDLDLNFHWVSTSQNPV